MSDARLAELADARGIGAEYLDYRGERREVSLETRAAILGAMGIDVTDADAVESALAGVAAEPAAATTVEHRCHEPAVLAGGARLWGLCVQLYALRSPTNWGIGDFGDLARLARSAAGRGADFVGLNPLHALFAADPAHCSPYSSSSRHCLNVLYIAVEAIADFEHCPEARRHIAEPQFQQELQRLRSLELVDYPAVARCKFDVLRLLFKRFRRDELQADTSRARVFREFVTTRAATVGRHALFEALDAHMREHHGAGGWLCWPEAYRDPASEAVARFARQSADEVDFHAWLQWIAETQLAGAARIARKSGMRIGLYGDYAVGSNPGGSEAWSAQDAYCQRASIGAPPDALALKGQDWGLPPPDPAAMRRDGCRGFSVLMRDNMRHFGALRLDHVMALYRLWWVPQGRNAGQGGYVQYPVAELFEALATESRRNGCLVVGEDLGTVPREVGRLMRDAGVYGYSVLYFERDDNDGFRVPTAWRREALASVTTHDLPSLRAWWEGSDVDLRERLGMYPPGQDLGVIRGERQRDRDRLLDAMAAAGVRPRWPVDHFEPAFAGAVHAFLATTASALVAVQAEDLLGMTEPVNVPGTDAEFPNWRRRLVADVDALLDSPAAQPILDAFRRLRPR